MRIQQIVPWITRSWIVSLTCTVALAITSEAPAPRATILAPSAGTDQQAPFLAPNGFGEYEGQATPCLTNGQRLRIQSAIASNQRMLSASGGTVRDPFQLVRFGWPVVAVGAAAEEFGVHGISNFVDQDPTFPGNLLDYNCGTRTYDVSNGYNHRGVDIFT